MSVDWRVRLRRVWAGVCLVLVVAACGGGDLSLSEYSAQGGAVSATMETRIATLDAEWDTQTSTLEGARTYWDRRLKARAEALEGFRALDPPDVVANLHGTGLELFIKLVAAEEALAGHVASFETVTEPGQWWATAEGIAALEVQHEINAFCQVFQSMYDATIERAVVSELLWIPAEMKEIVQIDLGCRE
ncbi:MAG: hypothetical protein V3S28_02450 [Acidimicrobiia bacterium]